MLHQDPSLSELTRQVVGLCLNLNLEVLGDGVVDVLVQLLVLVEELKLIGTFIGDLLSGVSCTFTTSDFLHTHQNFIDSCNILLNFSDIVLKYGKLNSLSTLKSSGYGCILIFDVFVNNSFNRLDLIDSVIKSHNLTD